MGFKLLLSVVCLALANAAPSSKIDSTLLKSFQTQKTVNIFFELKDGSTAPVLEKVNSLRLENREDKLNAVGHALQAHAESTQASVRAFLDGESIKYIPVWISNKIFINDASLELVERLAARPDVEEIFQEIIIQLDDIVTGETIENPNPRNEPRENQWGVLKIEADRAWATSTGAGVVIGGIDTGVHGTHQDLAPRWRSDYGWLDPTQGQQLPFDNNGHGTHTIGTIVGANGIGVAPGAQWIACKGCASSSCSNAHLEQCGQWMLCPTRPDGTGRDCTKAPRLVSNSWAGGQGNNWYDAVTDAWIAAGIIPVFAIGNAGSRCGSHQSPGDRNVISVGSTVRDDSLSSFSSRGPVTGGAVKPEISAPGSEVYSAYHTSNTAYTTMSGTSMATPHAAGTIALIQAVRQLSYAQTKTVLQNSAVKTNLIAPGTNCGGSDSVFPNNAFGHGRINAYASVVAAKNMS